MSLRGFLQLVLLTLRSPREAAQLVMALLPTTEARLLALGAVMASSAALGAGAQMLFAFVTKLDLGQTDSPVPLALVQGGLILYAAAAMTLFGRQFGGKGQFGAALSLVLWIEAMLIAGQVLQIVVMVFFPLISVLGTLVLFGLMFWLLVQFTAALHGFNNLMTVGAGVVAVFFGSAMMLGVVMLSLGITPPFVTAR